MNMMAAPSTELRPDHDYTAIVEQHRRETPCALLPNARVAARRRRRCAGNAHPGMARARRVRRPQFGSHLAVRDRHQRVPPRIERRRRRVLPIDTGPSSTVSTATWELLDVWPDPYPTGGDDDPQNAGGAVRKPRAGLHRWRAVASRQPTSGACCCAMRIASAPARQRPCST